MLAGEQTAQQALDNAVERGNEAIKQALGQSGRACCTAPRRLGRGHVRAVTGSDRSRPRPRACRGADLGHLSADASSSRNKLLPYLLLAPQLAITLVFFFWPASQALYQSLLREDPFGLKTNFVGLANFRTRPRRSRLPQLDRGHGRLLGLRPPSSRWRWRCCSPSWPTRSCAGSGLYRTLLIWPYAVAPAIAGMLWLFLFNPSIGTLAYPAARAGHRLGPAAQRHAGDGRWSSAPPPGSRSATISCSSSPGCRRSRSR